MLTHFLVADGRYGKRQHLNSEAQDRPFTLEGYRFDKFGSKAHTYLPFKGAPEIRKIMPRKPVRLPPSHF